MSRPPRVRGIVGIEREIKESQEAADREISESFQDLKKLMEKALDMSTLAKSISRTLKTKGSREISEDETVVFKSHLLSLGVDGSLGEDPVTRKKFANDSSYYRELGRQIATVMKPILDSRGGQMALTDVYCTMNRARGMEVSDCYLSLLCHDRGRGMEMTVS